MNDLPAPLARDLVEVDHGTLRLEIEPVFEPFPVLLGWVAALAAVPIGGLVLAVAIFDPQSGSPQVGVLFPVVLLLAGTYHGWGQRPPLQVVLSMHRIELRSGGRVESLALADLHQITVSSRRLSFGLRDGRRLSVPLPDRSKATAAALEDLLQKALERGQARVGAVPAELHRLAERL
jgi:hypothetical protein